MKRLRTYRPPLIRPVLKVPITVVKEKTSLSTTQIVEQAIRNFCLVILNDGIDKTDNNEASGSASQATTFRRTRKAS